LAGVGGFDFRDLLGRTGGDDFTAAVAAEVADAALPPTGLTVTLTDSLAPTSAATIV
jgi:hypothetical protein